MPLSPQQQKALARLEEDLRADDPALVAALSSTQSSFLSTPFPLSIRQVLLLLAALLGLVAANTLFGDRLGVFGVAVLTCAVVVPWLIGTAQSAAHKTRPMAAYGRRPTSAHRATPWAILLIMTALALLPPSGLAVIGLVLTLVVMPIIVLRTVEADRAHHIDHRRAAGADA